MVQYKKLFDKSEIEYITPFLKLWMSFNNWYKQDLPDIKTDRKAIDAYKEQGPIKNEFLRLFDHSSDTGIQFQNALFGLVLNIKSYVLLDLKENHIAYDDGLILQNADRRGGKEPIYISQEKKVYQINEQNKDLFFKETLEIIYQVRCNLAHGSFDIENQYFINLVENSYKILYPIIERILQKVEEKIYYCKNRKGTKARARFNEGNITVLKNSRICKETTKSYNQQKKRRMILSENAVDEKEYFVLTKDVKFQTPSAASSFCLGASSNGWWDWKDRNGKAIDEILRGN